jgi:hypothetical protein
MGALLVEVGDHVSVVGSYRLPESKYMTLTDPPQTII